MSETILAIGGLGTPELIAIVAVVFLLFGATRLPQLAKSLGQSKRAFKEVKDSMFVIECDTIFRALGQTPRDDVAKSLGLRVSGSSLVSDDARVLVGGDCGNGGAEIVNAAAEGVSAAKRIHLLLSNQR